jgi:hypothetical protein
MTARKTVRLLTTEQLSERWQIPVETLKRQRRTRTGCPYVCIGRHRRYREPDVEAYEETHLVSTITAA